VTATTADLESETPAQPRIRVVIDGHEIEREGLKAILASEPDFDVVGETGPNDDPVALVAQTQAGVILLNPRLRATSGGPSVCAALVAQRPRLRILVVATYSEIDLIRGCIEAGAHGYVLKTVSRAELTLAVRAVHRGNVAVSSSSAARIIDQMRALVRVRTNRTHWRSLAAPFPVATEGRRGGQPAPILSRLTSREREVVDRLLEGERVQTIAAELFVSQSTIRSHLSSVFTKVGVHSQADLIRRLRLE
jgi:DNA-binding NarL/FixJ family response regulator